MRANNLLVVVLTLFVILPLVVEGGVFIRSTGRILTAHQSNKERLQNKLLEIRGGATGGKMSKTGKIVAQRKNLVTKVKDTLDQIKPATRVYLFATLFCTLVHLTGIPAPVLFSLDSSKLYELWRPFTSVSYLGAPSMSMANSLYFLIRYGQTLEETYGTGAHGWFLLIQTMLLSGLGLLLGFPFHAQSMIAAIIYVSSRINPMEKIPIQFGLVITAWQLPYCMMVIDCLSQQSMGAAWPHVLGIFTGHFFHFFTKVWPALGGGSFLNPPQWVLDKLGGPPSSNIPGIDFRRKSGRRDPTDENNSVNSQNKAAGSILNRAKKGTFMSNKKGRKLN